MTNRKKQDCTIDCHFQTYGVVCKPTQSKHNTINLDNLDYYNDKNQTIFLVVFESIFYTFFY